jgi:hypothetical protein
VSYGVRVRFGERRSSEIELAYADVAAHRGSLAWNQELAERVRSLAREVIGAEHSLSRPA